MKTRHVIQLGLVLMTAWLVGCTEMTTDSAKRDSERYGGILVINQFQSLTNLFPPASFEMSAAKIGHHVYETLVQYNSEHETLEPCLAESWEMNESGTLYSFKLREGVYFHDDPCFLDGEGREMTGEDVLYCLTALCEDSPRNKNSAHFVGAVKGAQSFYQEKKSAKTDQVEGIRLIDDMTLEIELSRPNVEFINILAHYVTSIYPIEMLEFYGKAFDAHPVGTGPFRNKVLRKNQVYILARNDRYWDVDDEGNQLPYLDGIKINIGEGRDALARAMINGVVHVIVNADMEENGREILAIAESRNDIYSTRTENDLETVFIGFLNDEGVFSDSKVRQAISMVIDKDVIANHVLNSSCGPAHSGFIPPGFDGYPYSVADTTNKLAHAQELLAEAGFPNGEGFPILTLQIRNQHKDVLAAQEIQAQLLNKLGLSLSITTLTSKQHFQRLEDRQAEIWLDNWISDFIDPYSFLSLLRSTNTPEEGGSYHNIYRYKNLDFDESLDEALKIKDKTSRMATYHQADDMLMETAAIVPIYYEKNHLITHRAVKQMNPPLIGVLDLKEVYLDE